MAKIETIIPFILYYETKMNRKDLSKPLHEMYELAAAKGFAKIPGDKGGATMCGVTLSTFRAFHRRPCTEDELRSMTYAKWRHILQKMFWDRWHADSIRSQAVANMVVDWLWHSGGQGIRQPQQILGVAADGVVGPLTIAALNSADPAELFLKLKGARIAFLQRIAAQPSQQKFLKGWVARVNAINEKGGFDI